MSCISPSIYCIRLQNVYKLHDIELCLHAPNSVYCYNDYFCSLEVSKEVIIYVNTEVNSCVCVCMYQYVTVLLEYVDLFHVFSMLASYYANCYYGNQLGYVCCMASLRMLLALYKLIAIKHLLLLPW